MKNIQKPFKVFLDTSVLLSGLNSPLGASGFIISLFKLNNINLFISEEVIIEAERGISNKFPELKMTFFDFLSHRPILIKKLKIKEIKLAYKIISSEDTPILAGAIKAKVNFLITLDKNFKKLAKGKVKFKILLPGEFLQKYREQNKFL